MNSMIKSSAGAPDSCAAMSARDVTLLQSWLDRSRRFLEFGAGASTRLAVATECVESIVSVESDPSYIALLSEESAVGAASSSGRLKFFAIDIGPTGEWGMPSDKSRKAFWPCYSLTPFASGFRPDVVLVDGRFRVACALSAALANPPAYILVHDYPWRSEYSILTKFLKLIGKGDTMAVFTRRDDVDTLPAEKALRRYLYAPDDFPATISGLMSRTRAKVSRRLRNKLFKTF
jgi:hypothetical protein